MKFVLFIVLIISLVFAKDCNEPETWGGASCSKDSECNQNALSQNINKNYCEFVTNANNVTNGHCVCNVKWGGDDCYHERYDKYLAGGLQFLCLIGVGGIGNFYTGRTTEAVLQLLMMFAEIGICCVGCFALICVMGNHENAAIGCTYVSYCVLVCVAFAGWIWCIVDAVMFLQGSLTDGEGYYPYAAECSFVPGY